MNINRATGKCVPEVQDQKGVRVPQAVGFCSALKHVNEYALILTAIYIGQIQNANLGANAGTITQGFATHGSDVPNPAGRQSLSSLLSQKAVIEDICSWVNSGAANGHIMWIQGFAGCGKSAIAQKIAEHFSERKRLAACFFFCRGAGDRSRASRFAASIASQMAIAIPATASYIKASLRKHPGLLLNTTSLSVQLDRLVFRPIKAIRLVRLVASLRKRPFVIVIDGLDECEDRPEVSELIQKMIDFFSSNPRLPFRVVVTSRVESRFHQQLHSSRQVLLLNLAERTSSSDIAAALDYAIENQRPDRLCDKSWPSSEEKKGLVQRIGISFTHLTTILRYLFDPDDEDGLTPMKRLPLILSGELGEADFDHFYRKIIDPWSHLTNFRGVVSTIALAREPLPIIQIAQFLEVESPDVVHVLLKLQAVIRVPDDDHQPVTLWHTTLHDFFCSKQRSEELSADPTYHLRLAYWAALSKFSTDSASLRYCEKFALEHLRLFGEALYDGDGSESSFDHEQIILMGVLNGPLFPDSPTALEIMCGVKDWKAVHALLKAKADASIPFKDGKSALEIASRDRKWTVVRALVKAKADVNVRFREKDDNNVITALHAACHHGELDIVYLLLENGADPNIVENGSSSDWNPGFEYRTPLIFASYCGHIELISRLLKCRADVNFRGGLYGTALQAACEAGKLDAVKLLLMHDGWLGSALHACATKGWADCAQALLEHGADPNIRDRLGDTPLHNSCHEGRPEMAEILLKFKADPTVRNKNGKTPLQIASNPEISQLLRNKGLAE
ncbi:hypothetical protein NMY22_g19539 [Coprinellus aureogranulatus]|nr:hypothetical protein NMY22_g19539 [Coprinellus aureogranulatus]